jgi:1-phosphatidylinositol-4-phosphate 5-kinase
MVVLERVLSAFALAQTIIATLRSGSRALYILRRGSIGAMDGPLILPPVVNTTDSSLLWEVSTAFRHCVELALDRDTAGVAPEHFPISKVEATTKLHAHNEISTYRLSNLADADADADDHYLIDEAIDALLLEPESDDHLLATASRDPTLGTRIRESASRSCSLVERNIERALVYTCSLSRSLLNPVSNANANANAHAVQQPPEDALTADFEDALLYFSDSVTANEYLPTVSDSSGDKSKPRIAHISAHAPQCFADLRSHFGITEESFRRSILLSGPFVSFQSNSKGAARAGGVFFFTRDGAYMIKTIKQGEVRTLLGMLPKYYRFMKRHGRRSLLTRFCGIYQVSLRDAGGREEDSHTIVVMNSVFPAEASKFLSERFDLKGSTVGRECSAEERQSRGSAAVLKDLDLIRESELVQSLQTNGLGRSRDYGNVIHIGASQKAALLSQLRKDVGLLVDCGVIDYSLLAGVVHMESFDLGFQQLNTPGMQCPRKRNNVDKLIAAVVVPVHTLLAPSIFMSRKAWSLVENTLSWPLPYYGSGQCVVDGGKLAQVRGERRGQRAIFYFGLIDFLQPFDFKKTIEWKWKGLIHEKGSFSCVPPEQYADRFLKFIDDRFS